jgi:hypothetical protein
MMNVSNICDLPSNICDLPSNICDLPSDIILFIIKQLGNYEYLIGLNITCKSLSKLISKFALTKEMFAVLFSRFNPYELQKYNPNRKYMARCVNERCKEETHNACEYIWEAHDGLGYVHRKQDAQNTNLMVINKKKFWFRSPYCCECFKRHVLVGNNKNVAQHYGNYCYGMQQVVVTFNTTQPSTWYDCARNWYGPLVERQVRLLNGYYESSYREVPL